ncbi:MAG TPA: hypothetical protein VJC18_03735, partial [bacterium]|nr:hypothetical protein [bacterium]
MSNEIHYIESDYCYDDYDDLGEQNTCEAEESDFEACASEAYAEKSCLLATRAFGVDDDVYFKEDNVARRTLMSAEHVSNASFAQDQFLAITKPPLMKILGNGPAQEVANVLLRGYRNYVSADRDTTNNETMWGSQEPKGFVYEVLDGAKALAREVTQKTGLDDFSFEKAEREVRDSIESVYHEMLREDEEKAELVANEEDVYEEQEWSEDESDYSEDDVCFSSEDYSASCWYEECEQELKTDNAEETSDEQEELETNENQQEFLMPITELVAAVPNEPQPLIIYSTLRQPTGQEGAGTTSTATRQPPSPQDQP